MQPDHTTALIASGIAIFIAIAIIASVIITAICWCLSMRKTMRFVPKEKEVFPSIFIWLTLIPVAGFIFGWLMIPFGIPDGLRNTLSDNPDAVRDARTLKALGLTYQILISLTFVFDFWNGFSAGNHTTVPYALSAAFFLIAIAFFVLWIVYWVKAVGFRKRYFENKS